MVRAFQFMSDADHIDRLAVRIAEYCRHIEAQGVRIHELERAKMDSRAARQLFDVMLSARDQLEFERRMVLARQKL